MIVIDIVVIHGIRIGIVVVVHLHRVHVGLVLLAARSSRGWIVEKGVTHASYCIVVLVLSLK